MMFSEIGSEFWIECNPETLFKERDGVYCLSGRTAIDLILQDILRKRKVKSVAMPAWCCDSMIATFLARGIEVVFYDFGQTDTTEQTDIFYLTNYFGYDNTPSIETIKKIKEQGRIVLYDRTHSFLMEDTAYQKLADYAFASIRKWMGVVSGAVINGLKEQTSLKEYQFIPVKVNAMLDKYRFLTGDSSVKKDDFLYAFGEFGHKLAADYSDYKMDNLSYTLYRQEDLQSMKQKRKRNAGYIHEHLDGVKLMFDLTESAVPLFVPVLFESKEQRDFVRKKLIEQQIYCPIHWPQPSQIPAEFEVNSIVSRELSLICDQRYEIPQIKREIETIKQLI